MCWEYWLPPGKEMPEQNPDNPKYKAAINAWQKLPVGVANVLGPHIVRGIA
jgi:serine/alanine adding enzyme